MSPAFHAAGNYVNSRIVGVKTLYVIAPGGYMWLLQ